MKGNIHSTLSFGTVDGPGIRYVIFLQGCPLRCLYCHNPDSWNLNKGLTKTTEEIVADVLKYKRYFKDNGGVTLSGGEPLIQLDFVYELCQKLKNDNINICIDTSGITFTESNKEKLDELIKLVDLFILDIKHIKEEKAVKLTGHTNKKTLDFAKYLSSNQKPMWIRYVLVPGYTDDLDDIKETKKFINNLKSVENIEVLPYHKMGIKKYEELKLEYPLKDVKEPTEKQINDAKDILIRGV